MYVCMYVYIYTFILRWEKKRKLHFHPDKPGS